ncbi:MAG TPA: hypothetical protein VNG53_04720 [Bacteroidia bacterium]|nr:hypothetical protein [Bacteroidia bacterium]
MSLFAVIFYESVGAFIFWMLNGFKGKYKTYLAHNDEKAKKRKNGFTGLAFYIVLYLIYRII